jgi:hypothetical protein
MPVHPDDLDAIAARVVALYREMELALVELIHDFLNKGWESPSWVEERLTAVRALRRAAQAIVNQLTDVADARIRAAVADAYRRGGLAAAAEVTRQTGGLPPTAATVAAAGAVVSQSGPVDVLAAALIADVGERSSNVVRDVVDVYRAVTTAASARVLGAGQTRRQAAQAAWQGLTDRGITSFTDVSGRRWQLSSYVEMATRTVTQRAAVQGQTDRQTQLGLDLVYVSNAPQECKLCRPWEAKVLRVGLGPVGKVHLPHQLTDRPVEVDIAGTLPEARLAGLFHPNCRHSVSAYLPGVTKVPAGPTADPEGDAARQRQRAIERAIRKWKTRDVGALDPDAKTAARRKVRQWQGALRDHLAANPGLKRLRYREQPGAGNIPAPGSRNAAGAV